MNKIPTRTKKNIQVIACILVLSVFYLWLYSLYITPVKLKFIETESDVCVAYSYAGSVCIENKHIDLDEIKKQNNINAVFRRPVVYCVTNEKIFFSFLQKSNSMKWTLASVDSDGENYREIFCETFDDSIWEDYRNVSENEHYFNRYDYYLDGKIILTDFSKLIEYDIESDSYTVLDYSEYPKNYYGIEYDVSDDFSSITIKCEQIEFYLDKGKLAELSPAADEILRKYDRVRLDPSFEFKPTTEYFFDSIRIVDGEIYLLCRMLDFLGTSYAFVFKIDVNEKSAEYVGGYTTVDVLSSFDIIPILNN